MTKTTEPERSTRTVEAHATPLGPAACVLAGMPWLPQSQDAALTLSPGGPAFVLVTDTRAEIEIPVGKANHVFVRMSGAGWHVAGHLPADSFSVQPLRVAIHDGYLMLSQFSELDLVLADEDTLWLTARPPVSVRPTASPTPLPYACSEVNVGPPPELDAETELPGVPGKRREVKLGTGEIPLSVEPGADPVAHLLLGDSDNTVIELEQKQSFRRIALTSTTTLAFGWVPKSALSTPRASVANGGGGLELMGMLAADDIKVDEPPGPQFVRCSTEVPVVARVGEEALQVGRIDPGTPIGAHQASHAGGVAQLKAPDWLRLAAGASFETPTESLAGCAR